LSGRLVGEVVEWLQSPAADDLTLAERTVLMVIAERSHERTREMWRHRGDDCTLFERIMRACGLDKAGLTKALRRLAGRGLDVRVPLGTDARGRPVYAHRGRAMRFRLPELPASVSLPSPERVDQEPSFSPGTPVDNPVDNDPSESPADPERVDQEPPIKPKGWTGVHPLGPKGWTHVHPYPYKNNPSTTDPSTQLLSSPPEEEGDPARADPRDEEDDQIEQGEQRAYLTAHALLQALPDLGAAYLAQAARETPGAGLRQRVIRAAQLARERTPA